MTEIKCDNCGCLMGYSQAEDKGGFYCYRCRCFLQLLRWSAREGELKSNKCRLCGVTCCGCKTCAATKGEANLCAKCAKQEEKKKMSSTSKEKAKAKAEALQAAAEAKAEAETAEAEAEEKAAAWRAADAASWEAKAAAAKAAAASEM